MTTEFLPYLKSTLQAYCSETHLEMMVEPLVKKNLGLKVLLISPHPDDEAINGALALRLCQNYGCEVYNFPFTFGSNQARQEARKLELIAATKILNFKNIFDTNLEDAIKSMNPQLIIYPHSDDGHFTHIKSHMAVTQALKKSAYSGIVALTEFWFPNRSANLLLEISLEECAQLMSALSCHVGEIKRNPYHLRLPFWMMDNTRRGSELILGHAVPTQELFLTNLYQIKHYKNGDETKIPEKRLISLQDSVSAIF